MILRLVIIAIVLYLVYKVIRKLMTPSGGRATPLRNEPQSGEDLVEDPYCHTYLPVSQAVKREVDGKTVYFCQ